MVSTSLSSSPKSAMPSSPSSGGSRRRGRKQRKMRGGYSSAATYEMATVGSENDQYNNTFIRGGPFGASIQNLAGTQPSNVAGAFPSAANLKLIQSAGSRRRRRRGGNTSSSSNPSDPDLKNGGKRRRSRSKRGGYWGNVISQALVPFTLLFAQNRYGTRKQRK